MYLYTCIGTTVLATPNMKVCNKYIIKSQNKFLFCSSIQFDIGERIKLRCLRTGYLGIFIFYENYDRFCHIFTVFMCSIKWVDVRLQFEAKNKLLEVRS